MVGYFTGVCSESCPRIYEPVCDTEGLQHMSYCHLALKICEANEKGKKLGFAHFGYCLPSGCRRKCPEKENPLCDSLGKTHKNDCLFAVAYCRAKERGETIRAVRDGECKNEEDSSLREKCCRGNCAGYRGEINTSASGLKCQPWSDLPYSHNYHPDNKPYSGLRSNHCRNPSKHENAWCYVKIAANVEDNKWENCTVPLCPDLIEPDCCRGKCESYRGKLNTTSNGLTCKPWINLSRSHENHPFRKPLSGLEANYCRNPSDHENAWCYVQKNSLNKKWDDCSIRSCDD